MAVWTEERQTSTHTEEKVVEKKKKKIRFFWFGLVACAGSLSQHVCFLPSPAPEFAAPYSSRVPLAATLFSTHMRVGELCVGEHGQAGGREHETVCVGIYICLIRGF